MYVCFFRGRKSWVVLFEVKVFLGKYIGVRRERIFVEGRRVVVEYERMVGE